MTATTGTTLPGSNEGDSGDQVTQGFVTAPASSIDASDERLQHGWPVHCKEPMTLTEQVGGQLVSTSFGEAADADPPRVLRCRCGFQMDVPARNRLEQTARFS
jgi:hypothetical protein